MGGTSKMIADLLRRAVGLGNMFKIALGTQGFAAMSVLLWAVTGSAQVGPEVAQAPPGASQTGAGGSQQGAGPMQGSGPMQGAGPGGGPAINGGPAGDP